MSVVVEVLRRDVHRARGFDHEQVRLRAGVEVEAVGGASRDADVVERPEGKDAELREEPSAALVNEDDLVVIVEESEEAA